MPFDDLETSIAAGRPCRLYLFERSPVHWAYTNADRDLRHQGRDYLAVAIDDDGIRLTGETSADTLTVTCPADLAPAVLFQGHPPSDEIWLTIRDTHAGLPDQADSAVVAWIGALRSVSWKEPGTVEIACGSLTASMGQSGLRLSYERNCPHSLYDSECRVTRQLYATAAEIIGLSGASISVQLSSGWDFTHGVAEWTLPGGVLERRGIETQSGSTLTLLGGTAGLALGQTLTLFPGCDQTSATCDEVFDNLLNYGGFRHLPGKSPFDGNPIY